MQNPRQSGLPKPKDTRGIGENGLPMLHMGRVVKVHARTVDVMLDDLTLLNSVPVMSTASGPDRDDLSLPAPRSLVGVMYCWGNRLAPVVMGVFDRDTKTMDGGEFGLFRRVFPSGTHVAVRKAGTVEIGFADGSTLAIGLDAPKESHAGKDQESADGNPMSDPANVSHAKPAPFQLVLSMADGSKLEFRDKNWTVTLAKDATITAIGDVSVSGTNVSVQASGAASFKGANVTVEASGVCDVKGSLLKLNGGSKPIARVGDLVVGGVIFPPGNLTVLA